MTIELGEKIMEGSSQGHKDNKPLKAFYKLAEMAEGFNIEGIYQGTFESKKYPGSFFHIFAAKDGESYAYGNCSNLQEKIDMIKQKQEEMGTKDLYSIITFHGRVKNKAGTRSYYSFTTPTIYKVNTGKANNDVSTSDIPF